MLIEISGGPCTANADQDSCKDAECAWCLNDAKKLCVADDDAETAAGGGFASYVLADHSEEPEVCQRFSKSIV